MISNQIRSAIELSPHVLEATRRTFLGQAAYGVGATALSAMLPNTSAARGVVDPLHAPARAKHVIHLCMAGGPSHLETLNYRPRLAQMHAQPMPESFTAGQPIAQLQGRELKCLAPQFKFANHGASGQEISNVLPHIARIADDICIVRSMKTEQINHDPAHTFMNTGTSIAGRPSMGSWILYGLGNLSEDLPGYVVMTSVGGAQSQPIAARQWHSGFLPSKYQGVQFLSTGAPVLYLDTPAGVTLQQQRDIVDAVARINRSENARRGDPEVATRVAQYEMAFRMQTSVPELTDISHEPQHVLDLYGVKQAGEGSFASNCLLARRLVERGVRFVQLYHRGWDHHGAIKKGMRVTASLVDRASAALVTDLKQRGLLDDTLVIWGGEFGRTPMAQGNGRDHHIRAFAIWMAGGGVQGGITHGDTDELGYHATENVVHVHDLHATMLHLLGIDHERLTYRYQGRDFRLTDVAGRVVREILA